MTIYLGTTTSSVVATVLLVAPVAIHRMLFRRHAVALLVTWANRLAVAGFGLLGVAVIGVITLIVDVVVDRGTGLIVGVVVAVIAVTLWIALPLSLRRRTP